MSDKPDKDGIYPGMADDDLALMAFNRINARMMLTRLRHGARKFGALSWRQETYTDADNIARLHRAVDHLLGVLVKWRDPDTATYLDPAELRKRAADVANQAFMLADLQRHEGEGSARDGG